MKMQRAAFLASCLAFSSSAVAACSNQGDSSATEQSLDPLLGGDGGPLSADGGNPCAVCIQQSCGAQLTALETELKTLGTAAATAFTCVRDNKCLSMFWTHRDGGRAAASACVAACDAESGLPDRDAARGAVSSLATALDQCVDSSCASQCPGAANDPDDRDGGFPPPFVSDGSFPPHCDAGFPHFEGGFGFPPPPPLPHPFDGGSFPRPFGQR
jgi:hypothetical protein